MPRGREQGAGQDLKTTVQQDSALSRIWNEKASREPKGVGERAWGSRRADLGRVKGSGGQSE